MITLREMKDIEYFIELAYEDNKHEYTKETLRDMVNSIDSKIYGVYKDSVLHGTAGYFVIDGNYFLEALQDKKVRGWSTFGSFMVGKKMLKKLFAITNAVYTTTREQDESVQFLCTRLGFEQIGVTGNLILYKKEKELCQ
jgi:hypothetical protein